MKEVAVWDTYVKKKDGSVLHFDIIVPVDQQDTAKICHFGKEYLMSKNEPEGIIEAEACQFCHIESPGEDILSDIERQGFNILEMEDIPAELPEQPSRRDLILHLRAHYPEFRFADFKGKSMEEVQALFDSL
ncbi:MAG: DUF2024 family protein [Saprospiraceae bacterium]|nr:DUF2024 family protein [Saprospiraceae bacterium]